MAANKELPVDGLKGATCWVATEGLVGLQNQGIGLAEALGLQWTLHRVVKPGLPWKLLPSRWWPQPLALTESGVPLAPPWPDVLITCGRCSVATSLAVRRASGGRTFTVHVQDPLVDSSQFDVVVAPAHDQVRAAANVLATRGAVHRVDATRLAEAAEKFAPKFAALPRPLVAVLVGGSNRRQQFTADVMRDFSGQLAAAAKASGAGLVVTTSRRTGAENEAILRAALADVPSLIWDGQGDNPYFGMLALADAVVVTCDSVSMISEACYTGRPVHVYDFSGGSKRFRRFREDLERGGLTRPFRGRLESWHYTPLDETRRAADFVRARHALRGQS